MIRTYYCYLTSIVLIVSFISCTTTPHLVPTVSTFENENNYFEDSVRSFRYLSREISEELKDLEQKSSTESEFNFGENKFVSRLKPGSSFPDLYLKQDSNSEKLILNSDTICVREFCSLEGLRISPNGKKIAFLLSNSTQKGSLYISEINSLIPKKIASKNIYDVYFGNNNDEIIFSVQEGLFVNSVYKAEIAGEPKITEIYRSSDDGFVTIAKVNDGILITEVFADLQNISLYKFLDGSLKSLGEISPAKTKKVYAKHNIFFVDKSRRCINKIKNNVLEKDIFCLDEDGYITDLDSKKDTLFAFIESSKNPRILEIDQNGSKNIYTSKAGCIISAKTFNLSEQFVFTEKCIGSLAKNILFSSNNANSLTDNNSQNVNVFRKYYKTDFGTVKIDIALPQNFSKLNNPTLLFYLYGAYSERSERAYSKKSSPLIMRGIGVGSIEFLSSYFSSKDQNFKALEVVFKKLAEEDLFVDSSIILRSSSAGGVIASAFALTHPKIIRGLILENPVLSLSEQLKAETLPGYEKEELKKHSERVDPEKLVESHEPPLTLITASLDDSVVDPNKTLNWVQKVRAIYPKKQGVLLYTNKTGGHRGVSSEDSGRFLEGIRTAWILNNF